MSEQQALIADLRATIKELQVKVKAKDTGGDGWKSIREHLLRIVDRIEPAKAVAFGATTALVYLVLQNEQEVKKVINMLAVGEVVAGGIVAVASTIFAPGIGQVVGLGIMSLGLGTEIVTTTEGQLETALLGDEPDWEKLANYKADLQNQIKALEENISEYSKILAGGPHRFDIEVTPLDKERNPLGFALKYSGVDKAFIDGFNKDFNQIKIVAEYGSDILSRKGGAFVTETVIEGWKNSVAKLQTKIAGIPAKPFITKKDATYLLVSMVIAWLIVEHGGDIIRAAGGIAGFVKNVLFVGLL